METFIKDKNLNSAVLLLIMILSVFTFSKFINEIKESKYIGRGNQPLNTISVQGEGEVLAVSDIATISVNLNKESKTSKEAQDLLNTQIKDVLKYLKDQKIEDKDIKSSYGGVTPKYSYERIECLSYPCPPSDPKITGYQATQTISIKVRDVDNSNEVRLGLTNLGVVDIQGPTFSIDDEENLKTEARALAIKNAKEKAEILAKDLGIKLGSISNFYENSNGNYPAMYSARVDQEMMKLSSDSAPELPKGENKIKSNVTITYEIK